jgi:nitroreductase
MPLTIASWVPDHGKLAPWRFIVFEGESQLKAGAAIAAAFVTNIRCNAGPDRVQRALPVRRW